MRYLKAAAVLTGALAGAALMAGQAAMANPVTVDGVTFNSGSYFQSNQIFENSVSKVGDELSGYGQVTAINGGTTFCSNCDLAFTFSGYTATTVNGQSADFSGGMVNFYVIPDGSFDASDPGSAMSGTLFLQTTGHSFAGQNNYSGRTGTLLSTGNALDTPAAAGTGIGQLDATGGDAMAYFDTNTIPDFQGGFADFVFTTDFGTAGCASSGSPLPICGSASLQGKVGIPGTSVPEPSALGLMGLGLIGLGFAFRRRYGRNKKG